MKLIKGKGVAYFLNALYYPFCSHTYPVIRYAISISTLMPKFKIPSTLKEVISYI